jgi:hypothetical protein
MASVNRISLGAGATVREESPGVSLVGWHISQMARPLRIGFPRALRDVSVRGNERRISGSGRTELLPFGRLAAQ